MLYSWIEHFLEQSQSTNNLNLSRIPRRRPVRTKHTKPKQQKQYNLSSLQHDKLLCNVRNKTCECQQFFKSFIDDATYVRWKVALRKQYDKLRLIERKRYLNKFITWKQPKVCPKRRAAATNHTFKRTYKFQHYGYHNVYNYDLCPKVFWNLFDISCKRSGAALNYLKAVWDFKYSGKLLMDTAISTNKDEPQWLLDFEVWFLENIRFEWTHYAVQQYQYLTITSQQDNKILTPQKLLTNVYLSLAEIVIFCTNYTYL